MTDDGLPTVEVHRRPGSGVAVAVKRRLRPRPADTARHAEATDQETGR